jgi:hypothetical protein
LAQKRLVTCPDSGDFHVSRHASWGISAQNKKADVQTMTDMYRWRFPHPLLADYLPKETLQQRFKCILTCIMKNEAPYIVEWAVYHYALGFREILVFSNHSDDYSDQILDRLDDLGIVRHRPHPINSFPAVGQVNISALRFATCFPQFKASDYMMMIDADEFVEVFEGDHDLNAFFAFDDDFDVASLVMRGRSAKDNKRIGDGRILPRFLQVAWEKPHVATSRETTKASVKSLARSVLPKGFHRNHRPMIQGFSRSGRRWIDGTGAEFGPQFTDDRVSSVVVSNRPYKAWINHYALRSAEGFLVKMARGDAAVAMRNSADQKAVRSWLRYWSDRSSTSDRPEEKPHTPPLFDELYALIRADPIIDELQAAALAVHRAKAQTVLDSDFGDLIAKTVGLPRRLN